MCLKGLAMPQQVGVTGGRMLVQVWGGTCGVEGASSQPGVWHGHIGGAARHLGRQRVGGWEEKGFLFFRREDFAV